MQHLAKNIPNLLMGDISEALNTQMLVTYWCK